MKHLDVTCYMRGHDTTAYVVAVVNEKRDSTAHVRTEGPSYAEWRYTCRTAALRPATFLHCEVGILETVFAGGSGAGKYNTWAYIKISCHGNFAVVNLADSKLSCG